MQMVCQLKTHTISLDHSTHCCKSAKNWAKSKLQRCQRWRFAITMLWTKPSGPSLTMRIYMIIYIYMRIRYTYTFKHDKREWLGMARIWTSRIYRLEVWILLMHCGLLMPVQKHQNQHLHLWPDSLGHPTTRACNKNTRRANWWFFDSSWQIVSTNAYPIIQWLPMLWVRLKSCTFSRSFNSLPRILAEFSQHLHRPYRSGQLQIWKNAIEPGDLCAVMASSYINLLIS